MIGEPSGAEHWTLNDARAAFQKVGCQRLFVKVLAVNDDSKKQIYFGGDLSALSLLPFNDPYPSGSNNSAAQFANLKFAWLVENDQVAVAPNAKLIVYPDYPEVRFSGFLKGAQRAPSEALQAYAGKSYPDRLLFLGVKNNDEIVGAVIARNARLAAEIARLPESELRGVFRVVALMSGVTTRELIARRLCEVHRLNWLPAQRLSGGRLVECKGSNCGGYTLEAALGVSANGIGNPDFLGWEVKQHAVNQFERPCAGPVTLFTPEPKGGFYVTHGIDAFVRKYGYQDQRGREHRLNFGGLHRCGEVNPRTGLSLCCTGFDSKKGCIADFGGGIELIDGQDGVAARWSFADLLVHWTRKHAAAVFVPSMIKKESSVFYRYGSRVSFGEGTDFLLFLRALTAGRVYYDPGIKLEAIDTEKPVAKKRSQFRAKFADLGSLYHRFEESDVCSAC
jgi:hypothetical protein